MFYWSVPSSSGKAGHTQCTGGGGLTLQCLYRRWGHICSAGAVQALLVRLVIRSVLWGEGGSHCSAFIDGDTYVPFERSKLF